MKFTGPIGRLSQFQGVVRKDMRQALLALGNRLFPETQAMVPEKSGRLKATGRVSVRAGEKQVTLRILYGDNKAVNYAAWVHENLTAKHKKGQAKYVEIPMRRFEFVRELQKELDLQRMARQAG